MDKDSWRNLVILLIFVALGMGLTLTIQYAEEIDNWDFDMMVEDTIENVLKQAGGYDTLYTINPDSSINISVQPPNIVQEAEQRIINAKAEKDSIMKLIFIRDFLVVPNIFLFIEQNQFPETTTWKYLTPGGNILKFTIHIPEGSGVMPEGFDPVTGMRGTVGLKIDPIITSNPEKEDYIIVGKGDKIEDINWKLFGDSSIVSPWEE